jgi:hypothetical protein
MKSLIVAGALLLATIPAFAQTAPAPAAAPAADSVATVYDKALGTGWQNWSWAQTELSTDVGAHKPIMMDDQKGYGGLYLHHDAFSTQPYRALSMLIQVVGGPAKVRVMVIVGGKPIPDGGKMEGGQPVMKMKMVALAPGGWTQVLIPLSSIGAENVMADGVQVMNDSGQPAPHIYVADIAFKP